MRWLLVGALVLALAGCGEKAEPNGDATPRQEPFTVVLDYLPNADHAGIFAAQAAGLYTKAGLDVKFQTPPGRTLRSKSWVLLLQSAHVVPFHNQVSAAKPSTPEISPPKTTIRCRAASQTAS